MYANEVKTWACFLCVTRVKKFHLNMKWRQLQLYIFSFLKENNINIASVGKRSRGGSTFVSLDSWFAEAVSFPIGMPMLIGWDLNTWLYWVFLQKIQKASSFLWSDLKYYRVILPLNLFVTGSIIYISCIHVSFCREYISSNTVRTCILLFNKLYYFAPGCERYWMWLGF